MTQAPRSLSLIVPFHRDVSQLRACLEALATSARGLPNVAAELLVAADGAPDDPADVARAFGARVVVVPGPSGPAAARNRAAAEATGEVLVFVDSDVVVHADALTRIVSLLDERREVTAVFGAYDERPAAQGLVSQAKNLAHTFVHQGSAGNAVTFWAGLGAVRAEAFWESGGFDERFRRPSIEDIDLGYRLTGAGHRIVVDPSIRGTHLKHWTTRSALASDLRDRGIPWTQLIPRYGGLQTTLNLAHRYRVCVVLAYVVAVGACAAVAWPGTWPVPVVSLLALLALDSDYFLFMARCRGWWFAARTMPLRLGHHLANGVSFVVGNLLYLARRLGVQLPGSLPLDPWTSAAVAQAFRPASPSADGRPPTAQPPDPSPRPLAARKRWTCLLVVAALAAGLSGRGLGDESVTPPDGDAPRYMMNGAFLLDAVRDRTYASPQQALDYARHYYGRYPALSLGHHPFVLPLLEVPAFAVAGVGVTSARIVGVLSFGLAAAFLFLLLQRHHGVVVATLGGALFATNPYLGGLARTVLSETPTLTLILAAALFLDRFCDRQRRRDLVAFVLTAAASAYSKQLAAALYPAYLIHAALALGPRRLLRRDTVVATLVLCLLVTPLVPLTLEWSPGNVNWVAAESTRDDRPLADLSSLMGALRTHHPLPVLLLAVLGLVAAFQRRHRSRWLLLSWTVCGFAIVVLVTRVWEPARYGIYSLPAVVMLAAGAWTGWSHRAIRSLLVAALLFVIGYQVGVSARAPLPRADGFERAARFVVDRPVGATVLYSAEVDTGLFVFFVRKHDAARRAIVLRSDKLLTTSLLRSVSVEERIGSREEIYEILRRLGVGYVVLEDRPTPSRALNWLREEMRTHRFAERLRIPIVTNEPRLRGTSLAIYEFLDRRDPDPDAVVDMKLPLVGSEVAVRLGDLLSRKYLR